MNEIISLVLPSRERPERFLNMLESASWNAADPRYFEICLYLDEDDPTWEQYLKGWSIHVATGPQVTLSVAWNRAAALANGEILMHCGDDVLFRTGSWDLLIRRTFREYDDRIVFVHGRDGLQDDALGTHGFVHRRWVDAVGTFLPPYFAADYNDTWLHEVAERIGRRRYVPQLYIEHMHPAAGKAEMDATYRAAVERKAADDIEELYRSLAPERKRWATQLIHAMGGQP